MSSPSTPDPLAGPLRAALERELAGVGAPPASGAAAAMVRGRALRRARHLRWIAAATAGVVTAVVVVVVLWATVAVDHSGKPPRPLEPRTTGTTEPGGPTTSVTSAPTTSTTSPSTPSTSGGEGSGEVAAGSTPSPQAPTPSTTVVPPTTTTTAPTTTTTTAPAPPEPSLLVSTSPDRSSPVTLDGATLSGIVYVFYDHVTFPLTGPDVTFWIDDPSGTGVPYRVEGVIPYDLEATAPGGDAHGFDLGTLSPGTHSVTASAGPGHLVTATFTVS